MSSLIQKSGKRPYLIAGPCSAETEEQVMETVMQLQQYCSIDLLRAGIWKPRTRPDSFEGIGEIGLEWLVNAGKMINVPTTTEVANARHAELALKAGVDTLWIGARTTVNPFAVQEIADVLEGTKIPVLVKNPVNPDLELWIGAFERLEKAGITDLTAIHRGFSVYKHPKYRNVPSWELPLALRDRLPVLENNRRTIGARSNLDDPVCWRHRKKRPAKGDLLCNLMAAGQHVVERCAT